MQIAKGCSGNSGLLVLINTICGMTGLERRERFHFDKRKQSAATISDDQINLTAAIRFAVRHYRVTLAAKKTRRGLLASRAKRCTGVDRAKSPIEVRCIDSSEHGRCSRGKMRTLHSAAIMDAQQKRLGKSLVDRNIRIARTFPAKLVQERLNRGGVL
jgi:hypothetical protein